MSESPYNSPSADSQTEAARFLATAAAEIRALREHAGRTASSIIGAAPSGSEGGVDQAIVAELAKSLGTRAEELAAECRNLEELIDRVGAAHHEAEMAEARAQAASTPPSVPEPQPPAQPAPPIEPAPSAPADGPGPIVAAPPGEQAWPGAQPPKQPQADPAATSSRGIVPAPPAAPEPPRPPTQTPDVAPAVPASTGVAAAATTAGDSTESSEPEMPAAAEETGSAAGVSEGVKLLVTQMAVAGAGRAEIERRLVTDFGITDPASVLAELFGGR